METKKVQLQVRIVTGDVDTWNDVDAVGGWNVDEGQLNILDANSRPGVIYPVGAWLTLIVADPS